MRTRTSLRSLAVAAVAAVSLALLAPSVVQAAAQGANTTTVSKPHPKKQVHAQVYAPQQQSVGHAPSGCNVWPYVNQAPPCMSTWPAGDPNYHGSRPGPGP